MGSKDTNTDSNAPAENYGLLFSVLSVMILFTVCLGVVITIFCVKICKKFDTQFKGRKRTITQTALLSGENQRSSDEDENGYLIPNNPRHRPTEDLGDGCQPLITLCSEENLSKPSFPTLIEVPTLHAPLSASERQSSTYRTSHVYEEIPERGFYKRNVQKHLLHPYRSVRKVAGILKDV